LLEDLIGAAVNQGLTRAKEEAARSLQSIAGGLPTSLAGFMNPGGGGGPSQ